MKFKKDKGVRNLFIFREDKKFIFDYALSKKLKSWINRRKYSTSFNFS